MKEALLYEKGQKAVKCTACKHYCIVPEGGTGLCGVRQNKNGRLYLLVYGRASAVNVDPIEKKPLYHFLPGSKIFSIGTVGCNFACRFCQNWDLSQVTRDLRTKLLKEKKPELIELGVTKYGYDLTPTKAVEICKGDNAAGIAYTYNEPIIFFEYLYDIAGLAKKEGLKNVFVSNGYESREALAKIRPYLDGINIDLKAYSNSFYTKFCSARLDPVLETIEKVHKMGIWLEVTTLLIPGKNDSKKEIKDIAEFIASIGKGIPWHVSAFYPNYKMGDVPPTSHEKLVEAYDIGKECGLDYIYIGNVRDARRSSTYCPKCNKKIISRDGYTVDASGLQKGKCKCGKAIPGVWK